MATALESARDLRALIDRNAREHEQEPVSAESVAALTEAGLFGAIAPRDVGGLELSFRDALDVYAEVAWADASTGWCLMASGTSAAFFGAWCPDELVERVFADGVPHLAGQFAPNGTAVATDGGYRVTGRYSFGSGLNDAEWVGAGVITQPSGDDAPEYRFALMPRDQIDLRGNWEVLGLQATASWDYGVDDVYVPEDATFPFLAPTRYRGGPSYDLGVLTITALGHAGWAIGVVRRTLDELRVLARHKQRMGASSVLAENERFLADLGHLEARLRGAAAWVREAFGAAEDAAADGRPDDPEVAMGVRAATVFVTHEGADIVRRAYLLGGTSALRHGVIERCFRDIHAGTQHAMANVSTYVDLGRSLMATAPADALDT